MDLINIYGLPILVSLGGAAGGSYAMNSFMHSNQGLPTWAPYVTLIGTAAIGVYFVFPEFGIEGLGVFSAAFAAVLQHVLHMLF
jgi:hypothetical protein